MSGEGSLFDVPPAAIGRFRVLHQVGAGTSGPVFRAAHPDHADAPLAIKLVTLPLLPERTAAVAAEFESLVGVLPAVDGVCRLIAAGSHATAPYFVSSFAPGDSLDVALKQFGPAAIADLLPRLRSLAQGLDAAAGAGVLHGALHLRDVLVSDATTMLTGVGVWSILSRAGERLPIRRPYRAPELSETAITAAGDRFSLAALAYEWMTGRRAPSTFVAGDMAPMSGADRAALGRIFARALHADPAERYDTCEAFVVDLEGVEVDDVPVAETEAPRDAARSRKRGGRGSIVPVGLPLEVAPSIEAGDLRMSADEVVARPEPPTIHHEPELTRHRDDPEPPTAAPAAAAVLRPVTLESPSSSRLRDVPPPAGSRGLRLVAGLVLGLALGIGVGYVVWGRPGQPLLVGEESPVQAPAVSAPDPAADPAARAETPSPAPPPQPSAVSPAPAPSTPAPSSAPPGQQPETTPAPTPAPAAAATGNLLVRSTPAGATVFVDDERRGVTPLALQNVELGTRRVRVQRDGFTIEERQVNLTRSRPSRSVDVRLTRAAPLARPATPAPSSPTAKTGSLVIESRPTGASITLNGRQIGTTPMTIDDLEPGTYTVLLQLPTFRPIRTTVRVVAGARARAAASLVSAQEPQ